MGTYSHTWDEHALETTVFKYTVKEFVALRQVTLALSSLSLVFSALIITVYIYMLLYHRKQANRVMLRCVFLCSVADLLSAVLNICITSQRGDSQFCRASSVIIEFANIWSATLLTLVGLNLVLIFVINVKRRDLLEKFYYPCAVIYTFAGVAVPIHQQINTNPGLFKHYSCWYLKYVEDRSNNIMSWMWCYGFIFFVNIIAVCCSIMATIKLIREQRSVESRMHTIHAGSGFTTEQTDRQLSKAVKQRHNSVFSKVVMRCITYPLVPFLVNIFGFILQMLITATKQTPSYALAMLDIVFSCLEGVFVAGVFFTDPAITSFMSAAYTGWYEKYVEQYALVPQQDEKKAASVNSSFLLPCDSLQTMKSSTTAAVIDNQQYLNVYSAATPHSVGGKIKTVAMRRLQFKTDHHNDIRQHQRIRELSAISVDITTLPPIASVSRHHDQQSPLTVAMPTMPSTARDVYVPYRFPLIATCLHYILRRKSIANTAATTFTTPTAHKQDAVDTFTSNDIPFSATISPSSTVIVITEDCSKQDQQPEEIETIDLYTMLNQDDDQSSSTASHDFNTIKTHHV